MRSLQAAFGRLIFPFMLYPVYSLNNIQTPRHTSDLL